jgi:hypothetical protein
MNADRLLLLVLMFAAARTQQATPNQLESFATTTKTLSFQIAMTHDVD